MKASIKRRLLTATLVAMSPAAMALDHPSQSAADHRVRYVTYNPADVVQLDTVIGTATYIMLEPGESVITHAFGDSGAYQFAHKDHHLFLKPAADDANTNLMIVTDRRSYAFRLSFSASRNAQAVYKLEFNYPDTVAANAKAAREAANVEQAFEHPGELISWEGYTMSGATDIAPVHAWDNGRHTWLEFPENLDIPAIYVVDAEGNESLVGRHTDPKAPRTVVVHRTAERLMLRLGERALLIHNEDYTAIPIPVNTSRTIAPAVRRVLAEEQ